VAGKGLTLEMSNIQWIMQVWGTDDGRLITVFLVTNDPLACRNLGHELVMEDCDVMYGSFIWATHPNKEILKHRDSKLVVETSLTRLV
jgi:hypothetical protein